MHRPPPRSPLFPYTTLFRSTVTEFLARAEVAEQGDDPDRQNDARHEHLDDREALLCAGPRAHAARHASCDDTARSEEHTSELQSHVNLVCRLLLEKKKKKKN